MIEKVIWKYILEITDMHRTYIGTYQTHGDSLMFHVFESIQLPKRKDFQFIDGMVL